MELSKDYVQQLFSHLENNQGKNFFSQVSEDVDWTVMGTHPLAGHYTSKTDFLRHTFERLNGVLKEGVVLKVNEIHCAGNIATVEMRSLSTANNGKPFDNKYCWVTYFNEDLQVIKVRAYLDSALVAMVLAENEGN